MSQSQTDRHFWGRPGDEGFLDEIIDFDPEGRFHPSIPFHPIAPELHDVMDDKFWWDGANWREPEPGYALQKLMKKRQQEFTDAIQAHLDAFARTRGYDGILSAASYATSTVPQFKAEGQYAVEARDRTWDAAYAILGAVLAGERPMPTLREIFAELPALAWPDGVA